MFSDEQMQQLALTATDFETASTPPGWIFWDPDLYARDIEEIFKKMWLCVGHASRLNKPGEYFLVDVGNESIIVLADEKGQGHAFYNVCRHRGTRILSADSGRCRRLLCPYHAWSYGLDGTLKAAPLMDETPGFDKAEYALREVRLDTFMGFLFINLDAEAQPLATQFAGLPDFARFRFPELVRVGFHNYDVATNWKLINENYHECYHCAIAHPQLHRISHFGQLAGEDSGGENFVGGPMAIKEQFNTMTTEGVTDRPPLTGASEEDQQMVHYFNLLPNFLLSVAPDYVLTHYIRPRGPENVYIETEWFCSPQQVAEKGFDATDAIEFWDTTNKQDWLLCENALLGLKSAGHEQGPYQAGETGSHRFDRWYIEKMFPDVAS